MNVELLRQVKDAILEEPLRIDMSSWVLAPDPTWGPTSDYPVPPCGTIGCIYGWGQAVLTGLRRAELRTFVHNIDEKLCTSRSSNSNSGRLYKKDANIFELTPEQEEKLYFVFNWPHEFRKLIDDRDGFEIVYQPQTPEYARVVADRIEYMIATGE